MQVVLCSCSIGLVFRWTFQSWKRTLDVAPCCWHTLAYLHHDRSLPLSGSSCLLSGLSCLVRLLVYSLHKSIFVIAGCVEKPDTKLCWCSYKPTLSWPPTFCLSLWYVCSFSCPLLFSILCLSLISPLLFYLTFSLITAFCCSEKTEGICSFQQTCLSNSPTTEFESEQAGKGILAQRVSIVS